MSRLSIRWRLTLWYCAVLAMVLIIFGVCLYLMKRHFLRSKTIGMLGLEATEIAVEVRLAPEQSLLRARLERRYGRRSDLDIHVSTSDGAVVYRSDRAREPQVHTWIDRRLNRRLTTEPLLESSRGSSDRSLLLTRVEPGPGGPVTLQLAAPLQADEHALHELLAEMLLVGPLALASALVGGYLLAARALAPVDRMAADADQITANRLDRRLETPNPDDELGRLAATLNGMIERLESSFEEIRRFTADAAHELRTPLTIMRNVAEVALRSPREPEYYCRVIGDMLEEVEYLTRLGEQLLFLCREDAGLIPLVTTTLRLDVLAREAVDHMRVVAEAKDLALDCTHLEVCSIPGDADQLRRLIFNLLDNAIKFTPPGGHVSVAVKNLAGAARVIVQDAGIGIPPEHLPNIFDRFYRVDPARGRDTDGTGLGLAICRAIAETHGGHLEIDSKVGKGTTATLSIPA
jgi:two-component system, OmpR family, heavy metal sensor histidine kinase CusS